MSSPQKNSVVVLAASSLLLGSLPGLSARSVFSLQGPTIRHAGLEYVSARQFSRIEVQVDFPTLVRSAKLYFRAEQYSDFYYVEMVRDDDDRFVAILPIPLVETAAILYYVEVVDTAFTPARSALFRAQVTTDFVPGSFEGADAAIDVGSTTPDAPGQPPGFREDGIRNFIDSNGNKRPAPRRGPNRAREARDNPRRGDGGGGGGAAAAILAGVGAAAGAGYLVVKKQQEEPLPPPPPVTGPTADVSVTKTALVSGTVPAGTRFSYELLVTNRGPDSATNLQVTDNVPNDLRITATESPGGVDCGFSGQIVQCSATSLNAGQTFRVAYQVLPRDAPVTVTNRVEVRAAEADPNTGNNSSSATTTVGPPPQPAAPSADLRVVKTTSLTGTATAGVPFSFQLQVTNGGPERATQVELSDTVPSGLKFASSPQGNFASCTVSGQVVRCTAPALDSGGSLIATYAVVAADPGTVTNRAEVQAAETDPNTSNNVDSVTTTIASGSTVADIEVDLLSTRTNEYRIDLRNRGPTGAVPDIDLEVSTSGVKVNFDSRTVISSGFTAGCPRPPFTPGGLFNCGTSLAPNQSATLTFRVTPTAEGTLIITAATLACERIDPNCKNNTDSLQIDVIFLKEPNASAMRSTALSTRLETSSGETVRGEIALNGRSLGTVTSGGPRRIPFQAGSSESVVEAWTTSAAAGEGRWEFSFQNAPHFAPGSLQVDAGQVLSLSADRVVFRLSGAPGERLRFRFRLQDSS